MRDWYSRIQKRRKLERKRQAKLLSKAQKMSTISRLPEIQSAYSWNRKLGLANSLRFDDGEPCR